MIELRDALRPIVDPDDILALDRELAKWLMTVVSKRLRGGTVRADLATLAGKVAETFGTTTEGASLRASLPTLRRAAGLCEIIMDKCCIQLG